jgi:hypothetical protein
MYASVPFMWQGSGPFHQEMRPLRRRRSGQKLAFDSMDYRVRCLLPCVLAYLLCLLPTVYSVARLALCLAFNPDRFDFSRGHVEGGLLVRRRPRATLIFGYDNFLG